MMAAPEKMVTMTSFVRMLHLMYDDVNDIHVFSISIEVWAILGWNERRVTTVSELKAKAGEKIC